MKNLETNVVIKCDSLKQLKEARKKLIEMGYKEDKKWNDSVIIYNLLNNGRYFIKLTTEYYFQFHNHNCYPCAEKTFKEFFKQKILLDGSEIEKVVLSVLYGYSLSVPSLYATKGTTHLTDRFIRDTDGEFRKIASIIAKKLTNVDER